MKIRSLLFVAYIATALSCGSGPTVQPSPVVEDPIINCPSDLQVVAHNGQSPTVSFDTPIATKGVPPITVTCSPGSGTQFPNGASTVSCEVTDSRSRKASCTFSILVTPVPQLLKTKFMAFGDSLTEGKTTLVARSALTVPPGVVNFSASYAEQLNNKLVTRYQDQSIVVISDGWGGEESGVGKLRLERDWPVYNPDALLVLEGINDLLKPETSTPSGMDSAINSIIDALRRMIRFAKGRGAQVFVGTFLSLSSPQPANVVAAIPTVNSRIRLLAAQENAQVVDLNAVVPTTLLGSDGLHPKPQAYDMMADEWLAAIIATMEVKAPPSQ